MRRVKIIKLLLMIAALAVISLACGSSTTENNDPNPINNTAPVIPTSTPEVVEPEITNAYLSIDDQGITPTTTYSSDSIFYLIVESLNATPETTYKVEWYAENVDMANVEPNTLLDDYEFTSGESRVLFYYDNDMLSPNGTYRVDIYIDQQFEQSLSFTVEGGEMAITDVYLATDEEGVNPTTIFTNDDTFYLIVETANGDPNTVFRAEWYVVDVELITFAPNTKVDQFEYQGAGPKMFFNLDNGTLVFPQGDYRVDLFVNNALHTSISFSVEGGIPGVVSAYMSRDEDGITPLQSGSYASNAAFYLRIILQNATTTSNTKVIWYAENVPGNPTHAKVYEYEAIGAGPYITFDLTNTSPWPAGEYSAEIYFDGELITSLLFKVE